MQDFCCAMIVHNCHMGECRVKFDYSWKWLIFPRSLPIFDLPGSLAPDPDSWVVVMVSPQSHAPLGMSLVIVEPPLRSISTDHHAQAEVPYCLLQNIETVS